MSGVDGERVHATVLSENLVEDSAGREYVLRQTEGEYSIRERSQRAHVRNGVRPEEYADYCGGISVVSKGRRSGLDDVLKLDRTRTKGRIMTM